MNWFTRFLLILLFISLLAVDIYAITWITMGDAWVEKVLSSCYLPTHTMMSPYQWLFVILYITLLSMACLVALLKSIRFENLVHCKPIRGGDVILLTDKAIKNTIHRVIKRMSQVYRVKSIKVYNSYGTIKVKVYLYVLMGESIPEMRDEAERRIREVFDKILGVKNLAKPKIITIGLKEGKESRQKLAVAMGEEMKKGKKGKVKERLSKPLFPPMDKLDESPADSSVPKNESGL